MAYEKQTWVNNISKVNAERMNHIENGIKDTESLISNYEENDPTVPQHVKNITQQDINNWNSGGDSQIEVINGLTSTSGVKALSANQGRILNEKIENVKGTVLTIKEIANMIFPIGRGFIDFTNTNYSSWLGLTWERELVGLTPVGYKSGDSDFGTIGKTGGNKTHKHSLSNNGYALIGFDSSSNFYQKLIYKNYTYNAKTTGNALTFETGTNNGVTELAGNTDDFKALSPYKVVAYWKRVA